MKNHDKDENRLNRILTFYSSDNPTVLIACVIDEARSSNMKCKQTEQGFDLQLSSGHGGKTVYHASVALDGDGSLVSGEIKYEPWRESAKERSFVSKGLSVIGYALFFLLFLPVIIIFLLIAGIYRLFVKEKQPSDEEILVSFMEGKVFCLRKEDEN